MRIAQGLKLNGKIVFTVLFASLLMFPVISLFAVINARNQMIDSADRTAQKNISQNLLAIANSLWNFDKAALKSSLTGLTLTGPIFRAEVWENGDRYIVAQRSDSAFHVEHVLEIPLLAPDDRTVIGSLHVSVSYKAVDQAIFDRSIAEVVSQLLEICGLAGILLIIIHRLVIRHLESMSKAVNVNRKVNTSQNGYSEPREISLHRGPSSLDELDILVHAINGFYRDRTLAEQTLLQDLAERKRVETALELSEAKLSEALKISKLAYCEYSIPDKEFLFNSQYYALHKTNDIAEGGFRMSFQDYAQRLLHPEDIPIVFKTLQKAIESDIGLAQTEARIICVDGEIRWMLIHYKREQKENMCPNQMVIGVHQDMTSSKHAEQQRETIMRLTAQKEAAELANQAKSRFLAAASHDLRQPIHALHLFLGTLKNLTLPTSAQKPLLNVLRCTESIDEMFVALLDVSRLDAGLIQVNITVFPVMPLLKRIQHETEPLAKEKGLHLVVVPCSAWLHSDPLMVERILRNLVVNAIRYTHVGRVLVGCRRRTDGRLCIGVFDTGIGIPTDRQEKIFKEFYKDGSTHPSQPGLGLGLSIVYRLSKLLSAPLRLESTVGKGSQFSVSLPRVTSAGVCQRPALLSDGEINCSGNTVVVLDDDDVILDATCGLLEQWGCLAIRAETIGEAIRLAAESSKTPDALICDYHLRGSETGIDAITILREEFNSDIPALLITGDTSPQHITTLKQAGFRVAYKPLREQEFKKALAALLQIPSSDLKSHGNIETGKLITEVAPEKESANTLLIPYH